MRFGNELLPLCFAGEVGPQPPRQVRGRWSRLLLQAVGRSQEETNRPNAGRPNLRRHPAGEFASDGCHSGEKESASAI